jgi:hypothetical protein
MPLRGVQNGEGVGHVGPFAERRAFGAHAPTGPNDTFVNNSRNRRRRCAVWMKQTAIRRQGTK